MSNVAALIPCTGTRRHNEDWATAIRVLLSLPHTNRHRAYVNATYSALVWLLPEFAKKYQAQFTAITIPAQYFPEYEEESVCA